MKAEQLCTCKVAHTLNYFSVPERKERSADNRTPCPGKMSSTPSRRGCRFNQDGWSAGLTRVA